MVARRSSATCASATASCSAAASCRRSATRWRSSTRAPSAARRSARRRRSSLAVHNTPFGDIVDTEDDLQPLVFSMFRDATRAVKLVAAAMRDGRVRRRDARGARRRRLDDADRAGRHAGARSRPAVQDRARDRRAADARPAARSASARCRNCWPSASAELLGAPLSIPTRQLDEILSPRHFVDVRRTLGGPAPEETARAAGGVARSSSTPIEAWWTAGGRRRSPTQNAALAERSAAVYD